jgi:hypothetical protein
MQSYTEFLERKSHLGGEHGFDPMFMPEWLFDFQKYLINYSTLKGRSAIFADCGLGKTPMQLVWAQNVLQHTNKPVLIATPLAVSYQILKEANKFDIEVHKIQDGKNIPTSIVVTNYQRLHHFDPNNFSGMVCDESSILKNFDGATKQTITNFMRKLPYRLLCTATAAPNDYVELGTSSEALGELGHMDMLNRFFRNVDGSTLGGSHGCRHKHKERLDAFTGKKSFWRFKHHAEIPFWKWVCSWARAMRKPSDFGFEDTQGEYSFLLPDLIETLHEVNAPADTSNLFSDISFLNPTELGLKAERKERNKSLTERCEKVAELVRGHDYSVSWCQLNPEGDLLEDLIPGSKQVSGSQSDEEKEEILMAFSNGELKKLITKSKIAGFGLNWQHCNHTTFFPSHSYEQYYQSLRRFLRFGQKRNVIADMVASDGQKPVIENLHRKAVAIDKMFSELVHYMNESISISKQSLDQKQINIPSWLNKLQKS